MNPAPPDVPTARQDRRRMTWALVVFALGAFAFGYALVPLYRVLCNVTGIGDQTTLRRATRVAPDATPAAGRFVTIEFASSLPTVGNWEFRPLQPTLLVQPGRLYEVSFLARNLTGRATVAQAVPNIAPSMATTWFHKTECFCFTPQSFKRDELRVMPVRFFVDRDLPENIDRVTLSYTFYDVAANAVATR